MAPKPIIMALANPVPEIMPEEAARSAFIVATGRSDYPNQINNSICFPGFLRALLDLRVRRITDKMKIAAAKGIAGAVRKPTREKIVPDVFDRKVVRLIFESVKEAVA